VVTLSPSLEDKRLCPWRNIHLPSAKKTFAELLLHGTANSLGLSLFYSALAASCIHLSQRDQVSSDWDRLGKHYKQTCMHHLNLSIQQEVATEGQLPYKELLVALLSMIILEVSARFGRSHCDFHG
jgi:arginine metabolism regulation protein II